jgi:group I intron endonuclease
MLIWQTWFRDSLKSLSANVIGQSDKTGIYKITNIKTKECYIGQAVNIKDRWVEHAKCGLGIDTPAGNKLYKAIQNYGLWNFSFEILEECTKEQLNEKEKYYIDLYNSYNYGYNANKGVSK